MSDLPDTSDDHPSRVLTESDLGFAHPIDDLCAAIVGGEVVTAVGLDGAYAAATLTQLLARLDRRVMIVTPSFETSRSLATDLTAFGAGRPGREILLLPPPDVSPYGDISPDRNRIMERLNGQFRLAMDDSVRAVVTPIEGAMRKLIPWNAVENASTVLSVGEEDVDLTELRALLSRGGYSNVRLVEDPGTFAIRGGIIDIFSPYESHPVRIDLFGDEIESIRLFDAQTQRTFEELEEIFIFPVREELITDESLSRAEGRLRTLADQQSLPSSQVNELLRDLRSGFSFFGIESVLPTLYDLTPPLDTIGVETLIVLVDPEQIETEAAAIWERRGVEYERAIADSELAITPDAFYQPPRELLRRLRAREPRVELRHVGLEGSQSLTFRAHTNADVDRLRRSNDETEGTVHAAVGLVNRWRSHYGRIAFACRSRGATDRLARLLKSYGQRVSIESGEVPLEPIWPPPAETLEVYTQELSAGFRSPALSLAVVADREIFGRKGRRRSARVVEEALAVQHFRELEPGDYVVHLDFGIARYNGMEKLSLDGVAGDYLKLEFAASDRLYLPVHRLGRVQKYVAGDQAKPTLDKLGGTRWQKSKVRLKKDLRELADELLKLYAERQTRRGFAFGSPSDYFHEFEAGFPYDETPHQETAIDEVIADMVSKEPMDRLLCGDVGFGKTEVAMRAAFLCALMGKQTAVLVPTTILADQHHRTFTERFRNTPVIIEALSRFRSPQEQKQVIANTEAGRVDVLIGTHRILSKDVKFRDLGLLVVDEEQRFGVRHKERLKQLKATVDVLTMTATPIPRTLEMSLLGLRDLSVILTPPADRLAVRTYVAPFKESVVREGIERELQRGGQVFFVHNRVQGIEEIARSIREIVPNARVSVGHAQMSNTKLERVMHDFVNRKIDVLVCTTIIESGLDIVSANTIFINRSDALGLGQLYQLRGRVGRGRERAYCYLLVSPRRKLPVDAARRLEVIRSHTELGSGISIAQRDLDIRGAGNLLGKDQAGHIRTVGYDLFCELLEEAIREQRGEPIEAVIEPEVKIPIEALLPTGYMPDEGLRLLFYKRLSVARSHDELEEIMSELIDRFGHPPPEVVRLRAIIEIKITLTRMGIESVEAGPAGIVLTLSEQCHLAPKKIVDLVTRNQGRYVLRENMTLLRRLGGKEGDDILRATQLVLSDLNRCMA